MSCLGVGIRVGGTNGTPFSAFQNTIMKKYIFIALFFVLFFTRSVTFVSADIDVVSTSAQLKSNAPDSFDYRVFTLKNYLAKHNSPLEEYAEEFVDYADKYDLDWRLVPAIAGVESTFGKRIPLNSYNAYGWANGAYYFDSWENSIEIVSRTLREKYYDRGAENIYQIARRYAPPSSTWAGKVKFFLKKIDPIGVPFTLG